MKKDVKKSMYFKLFEYDGIRIFLHKGLKVKGEGEVYMKRKLPFLPPSFDVKGIS